MTSKTARLYLQEGHDPHGPLYGVAIHLRAGYRLCAHRPSFSESQPDSRPQANRKPAASSKGGVYHHQDSTGLGLAIVKRVVERHKGSVTASQRQDGGLTITLTLPAVDLS
jgi:hypothetical protein